MEVTNILLVEDNEGDVRLLEVAIAGAETGDIQLNSVATLADAFDFLTNQPVDLVLTDLNLPDSEGYTTFQLLKEKVPGCPIVILSGVYDEKIAVQAIKDGAQDFLVKGEYNQTVIIRVIRYAIERKQAEMQREQALQAAERATQIKSHFLATMSHELRTPMTGVIGMADLMLETDLSPQQLEWATSIKASGENLLTILNEVLDQSKLEAGKLEVVSSDFHLPTFIRETTQLFAPGISEKRLRFNVVMDETLPSEIRADRLRIGQVLSNLLSNALKFTHEGAITLRVEQLESEGQKIQLRFSVTDSGIGLTQDEKSRLFKAFTQADSSTSRTYGGTGLGLSISKQLVELMGGEIDVISEADNGSAFWFTIRCELAKKPVDVTEKRKSLDRWKTSRSLKILVAEDNAINQQLIKAILENLTHEVTIAENGEEAVEMAQAGSHDIILMDVRMPVMDGMEATKIIRGLDSDLSQIPILALTADIAAGHTKKYKEVGIDDVCGKPLDLPVILKKINNLLGEDIHTPLNNTVSDVVIDRTVGSGQFGRNDGLENLASFKQVLQRVSDIYDDTSDPVKTLTSTFEGINADLMIEFRERFAADAALKCREISEALVELAELPDNAEARSKARIAAHVLKGQGATFGYHLISTIAEDIEELIKSKNTIADKDVARLNNHVDAISLIVSKGITGHGGKVGRILLQGLEELV